ncbi:MAG: hypothetical protein ACXWJ0_01920 [Xanthobacteraceae bacterium]
MSEKPDKDTSTSLFSDLLRWVTTPPQSYVIYLIAFLAVAWISFFVGTLKPKRTAPVPHTHLLGNSQWAQLGQRDFGA